MITILVLIDLEACIFIFFPFRLNSRTKLSLVPGAAFTDTLEKKILMRIFGNNFFIASGVNFDICENIQLIGSYTYLFGPGNNSFNENLEYLRKPIYSYGFNWDASPVIGIEGKVTNGLSHLQPHY